MDISILLWINLQKKNITKITMFGMYMMMTISSNYGIHNTEITKFILIYVQTRTLLTYLQNV